MQTRTCIRKGIGIGRILHTYPRPHTQFKNLSITHTRT